MKTVIIKSEDYCACISTVGAQLLSFCDSKKEYMWQRDKNVWDFTAPVLFPICGRLKDNTYTYNGKTYTLTPHGFARFKEFETENITQTSVTFLLKSDEDTKKVYPFEFEFRVTFTLTDNKLNITYSVFNPSCENIYFSFGGHEAYACNEGAENYFVEFENDTNLTRYMLRDGFLYDTTENIELDNHKLCLKYKEFEKCTYVFKNINSKSVILSNKNDERKIRIGFDGHPALAIWTLPERKYVCIEPWCGFSQSEDFDGDITKKEQIINLMPEKEFKRTHYIEIL